jgi:uncharacterized protein (DUF58 family)
MLRAMLKQFGIADYIARIRAGLVSRFSRKLAERTGRVLPIQLLQRALYVLPTGYGFFLSIVLLVCVAGSLNYNNNLALAFAFLFCCIAFVSVHVAHRNLIRISLLSLSPQACFAGQNLQVLLRLKPSDDRARTCLNIAFEDSPVSEFELPEEESVVTQLASVKRGYLDLPPLTISTRWPFGIFVIWSHLWPKQQALIYPHLESRPPELPQGQSLHSGVLAKSGDEDLRSLRAYRPGDAPRQIAWRASARSQDLRTRELETPTASDVVLNYHGIYSLTHEAKIERLAAWCVLAENQGLSFELRAPGTQLGPDRGPAHVHACLKALALMP